MAYGPKCESCKAWCRIDDYRGECITIAISDGMDSGQAYIEATASDDYSLEARLITKPTFYCNCYRDKG